MSKQMIDKYKTFKHGNKKLVARDAVMEKAFKKQGLVEEPKKK